MRRTGVHEARLSALNCLHRLVLQLSESGRLGGHAGGGAVHPVDLAQQRGLADPALGLAGGVTVPGHPHLLQPGRHLPPAGLLRRQDHTLQLSLCPNTKCSVQLSRNNRQIIQRLIL